MSVNVWPNSEWNYRLLLHEPGPYVPNFYSAWDTHRLQFQENKFYDSSNVQDFYAKIVESVLDSS